jgi:class 3 adenylate cyclase
MVFADLVGFTTLSEARDPEEVRELLSSYFERARAVIERYGGTVEKFIGDAVFAVWGVPIAREDDAQRAVRAGLDLTSAVTALGEDAGIEGLMMRVGITTGQVAVTLGAVGEGMVAGDAVNTAARVQSVATPGQVWVDDTTRSLTSASLAYAPVGSFELKGRSVQTPLFHAIRTTSIVGGDQRVDGLEASFVGRDRDMRMVKELFHATIEESRPRLLLIAGEPGIGKSRVAWEFEKYVDAIPTHATYWMRARCLSYGEGVAGRTVAELIRYLLRLSDTDDDAKARSVLDERLAEHVADPEDRAVIGPRLESLLGLTDRSFEQADLFACWRAFLESLHASGDSVTIVIDDLQWGDEGLFDFIDHLLEAARTPIFVVALARPDVTSLRPGIGSGRRATTLYLEPLTTSAMSHVLDGLVEGLAPSLREELIRRAEGIPLYAVETVRALIDRDVVVPHEGRYTIDATAATGVDLEALGPPASLQSLLAARLDALSDAERRTVQDASVLGLTFTHEGIACLAPPDINLEHTLDSLRRKEIITIESDPRSPERGQFRFMQALLRTVAYDTLSRRDRQSRHLAVAAYLSDQPDGENLAAIIAEHYLDAAASLPDAPEAERARTEALRLLEVAALQAASVGAPGHAITLFDRLLDLRPSDETLLRITLRRVEIARQLGIGVTASLPRLRTAIGLAERLGRHDDLLALRLSHSTLEVMAGEAATAREPLLEIQQACLGRPELVHLLAESTRSLCLCAQGLGDPKLAKQATQVALDDIERYGDDEDFALYLTAISMDYGLSGYRRLATLVRRAVVPLLGERDPRGLPALLNLAATLGNDRPAEAWEVVAEGHRRQAALGLWSLPLAAQTVMVAAVVGTPEAMSLTRELIGRKQDDGPTPLHDWEAYLAAGSAVIAWRLGEPELMLPAIPDLGVVSDPVEQAWWSMREAVIAAFNGDADRAGSLAEQAVGEMAELGLAHEDMPLACALAVDLHLEFGQTDRLGRVCELLEGLSMGQRFAVLAGYLLQARSVLQDDTGLARAAVETFDTAGAGLPAALARVHLADRLLANDDAQAADAELTAAGAVLAAIGATPATVRIAALRKSAAAPSTGL